MNAIREKWIKTKLEKLKELESYQVAESTEMIACRLGIPSENIFKLNFNENLFIPRQKLLQLMTEVAEQCDPRIYPQEEEQRLREKISEYIQVPEQNITIGNASDELIDRITRLFLDKGDNAVSVTPTFPIFAQCTKRQGAGFIAVPLQDNFKLDTAALLEKFSSQTSLLYLCSPNNPPGNQFKLPEVETLIREFTGIVILDEAYAEFADYTMVSRINEFENLIVLRTFSKAFGLAALRLGYAVSNRSLAKALSEKATLPFPVSAFTLRMGTKILENIELMQTAAKELKIERKKLIKRLDQITGVQAFDSQANFVLFNVDDPAGQLYQTLLKRGLFIKKIGKILRWDNCFRSTVGLPHMNDSLLSALKEIIE